MGRECVSVSLMKEGGVEGKVDAMKGESVDGWMNGWMEPIELFYEHSSQTFLICFHTGSFCLVTVTKMTTHPQKRYIHYTKWWRTLDDVRGYLSSLFQGKTKRDLLFHSLSLSLSFSRI